jgi:four helix bundle protein
MRRSAVSVASNIAEGEGRLTPGERRNALSQARGSLFELSTQIVIATKLRYMNEAGLNNDIAQLRGKLDAYIAYVKRQ